MDPGAFYGIDRTVSTRLNDLYRRIYGVQDVNVRLDSTSAIRGHSYDMMWIDECQSYSAGTFPVSNPVSNAIDAEYTMAPDPRVDTWNKVWADIGEAYNKKVFGIIEG